MKSILSLSFALLPLIAFAAPDAASGAAAGGKPTAKPADTKPTAAADAKPTEAKPEKEKAEPKRGVGTVAMEAILNSATNEEALAATRKEFPDANTTKASINWYRNKLRKDGTICTGGTYKGKPVPNAREMAKDAKPAEAPKATDTKPTAAAGDDPTA
jgi:hypothetical protein